MKNVLTTIGAVLNKEHRTKILHIVLKHRFQFLLLGIALISISLLPTVALADDVCNISPTTWGTCAGMAALRVVLIPVVFFSYLMFTFSNWIFWMVAALFNWSVVKLVFQFSDFIGNSHSMLVAWGVLRDFGNIALLFGFIFMGIGTILNLHDFSAKKALPTLIIFAVLLNFSLFTAEAVIDASNLVGSVMYKAACTQGANCSDTRDVLGKDINVGLAGAITQNLHIGDIFGAGTDTTDQGPGLGNYLEDPIGVTIFYLGLAIFVLAAAAVFLAGAVLLISRGVILCFLMVTSPIGFAGMAIPPLHAIAKKWWDELLCQSLFAPVYLLMIFVSLKLAENLNNTVCAGIAGCDASNLANAVKDGDITSTGVFVIFGVVLAFLIGSLLVAREFSCIIGSKMVVDRAFKFIGGGTGALTFGSWAMLGRNTFGRTATNLSHTLPPGVRQRVAGAVGGYSFDPRKTLGLTALGGPTKDQEHGYHGLMEAEKKRILEESKNLGGHQGERLDEIKYELWEIDRDLKQHQETAAYRALPDQQAREAEDQRFLRGTEHGNLKREQVALNREIDTRRGNFATNVENNFFLKDAKSAGRAIRKDIAESPSEKLSKQLQGILNQPQGGGNTAPTAPAAPAAHAPPAAGGGGGGGGGQHGCWVAREVYGEQNPKWLEFRSWLRTKAPVWLWSFYMVYGERMAAWLKDKPALKFGIRMLMDMAIKNRAVEMRRGKIYVDTGTVWP